MNPDDTSGVHPWDRCMNMGGALMRHESSVVAVGSAPVPSGESAVAWAVLERLVCEGVDF